MNARGGGIEGGRIREKYGETIEWEAKMKNSVGREKRRLERVRERGRRMRTRIRKQKEWVHA